MAEPPFLLSQSTFEELVWHYAEIHAKSEKIVCPCCAIEYRTGSIEDSAWYKSCVRSIQHARERIAEAETLTDEQCDQKAREMAECLMTQKTAYLDSIEKLKSAYSSMLERVSAWEPPSDDHRPVKAMIMHVLEKAIKSEEADRLCADEIFDTSVKSGQSWRAYTIEANMASIRQTEEDISLGTAHTKYANEWFSTLDASVPRPTKNKTT